MNNFFSLSRITFISAFLMLSGCKEVLYSELSEIEANEMVAVLSMDGIASSRSKTKDGTYTLSVDKSDVAFATILLGESDLPSPKFQSLGQIFESGGLIGTPFEQHARYIHAMNQELSATLTGIDGVLDARVNVNIPMPQNFRSDARNGTASVTIHHEPEFASDASIAKIKQIVAYSLPHIDYKDVSVSFFVSKALRTAPSRQVEEQDVTSAGIVQISYGSGFGPIHGFAFALIFAGIILLSIFWFPHRGDVASSEFAKRLRAMKSDKDE